LPDAFRLFTRSKGANMQNYENPKGRNVSIAAGRVGGNQMQGAGTLPDKVNVPLPGTNATQPAYKGGMKQNVPGFQGGVIPGKI
jgi:hypothetical protein